MSTRTKEWVSPDGCIRKTILEKGKWAEVPREGSKCRISITNVIMLQNFPRNPEEKEALKNSLFFGPNVTCIPETIVIGEADSDLDRMLETCIHTMLPEEDSSVMFSFCTRELDTEDTKLTEKIPVPALKIKIALLEYEEVPHYFQWSDDKKYEEAVRHKALGVALFNQKRFVDAFLRFKKSLQLLIYMVVDSDETEKRICQLRGPLYSNMASCQMKRENYYRAEDLCTRALSLDEGSVKLLYRRGVARTHLQEYELACEDLEKAKNSEPNNEAVKKALADVKKKMKELDAKYGAAMKKAFNL